MTGDQEEERRKKKNGFKLTIDIDVGGLGAGRSLLGDDPDKMWKN
jgi:hypothetical protein